MPNTRKYKYEQRPNKSSSIKSNKFNILNTPKTSLEPYKKGVAVLAISTHGDIQVRFNNEGISEPIRYNIPDDMEIISLQVVPPSVPNLLPPKYTRPFMNIIKKETENFNEETTVEEMKTMVENIKTELIKLDEQPGEIENEIRKKNLEYLEDGEIMAYFHSKDKLYEINNYKKYPPFDKEYLRENVLTTDNTRSPFIYDWKINNLNTNHTPLNIYNVKGQPLPINQLKGKQPTVVCPISNVHRCKIDLMIDLNPIVESLRQTRTRETFTVTNLSNIIDFLHSKGIKKVILIDFSCSVIRNKTSGINSRGERYLAWIHSRQSKNRGKRKTQKVIREIRKKKK